ncbi:hypothetical protein EBESD8_57110 [Rhodococcus aetherivorans]|nr:hypothetical protein EBESD8_57110 [Rhodococcus aetherivorans]
MVVPGIRRGHLRRDVPATRGNGVTSPRRGDYPSSSPGRRGDVGGRDSPLACQAE